MTSYLPQWITDLATILTIGGFIITLLLLREAKEIRKSFIRKARIPEIVTDLERISKELIAHLQNSQEGIRAAHESVHRAIGLLESIESKLSESDKTKVNEFIRNTKKAIGGTIDENGYWAIYSSLSAITTYLQQLAKDVRWN